MDHTRQSAISENVFGNNTNVHQGDTIINVPQGSLQISSYFGTGQLNLEYAPASFNDANKQHASLCLPHTREQMLRDIRTWIDGNSEKGIYWLNGMAGTGKTTISLTIAHEYHRKKLLGASFFFSRGGGDLASAKKFALTVAVQLAEQSLELRRLISNATSLNPRIGHLNLYNQWEKLVLEPLGLLESSSVQRPLLLVVDALDECDDEEDIGMLIECFVSTIANVKEIPIRIFITSRPELPIHYNLSRVSINIRQHFTLHSIEQAIVDGDLRIYYQHHLSQLSQRYIWNQHIILDDVIRSLVGKTHGLFIYAATACRFIKQGGRNSERRMLDLSAPGSSASEAEKELDAIYTTVLESSFSTELSSTEAVNLQPEFQKIVGSVMVLFDTLALTDLVAIIGGQKERVESMFNNLRSVLDVSEDDRRQIKILHPSFRDFLLDPERCSHKTFTISAKQLHYDLFERCLVIMHGSLPQDICKLRNPAAKARDITKDQRDKCISFPIQYACRYWIQHLQRSGRDWKNHGGMKDFFWTDFLGWLEVLSLLGRLSEGINLLAGLESWLHDRSKEKIFQPSFQSQRKEMNWSRRNKASNKATNRASNTPQSLSMVIHDAKRFAFQHSGIIEETPLQIYCSALIFSPEESLIRQLYQTEIPSWIIPSFERRNTWPRYTQALWHTRKPQSLAFSPDGSYLASGCEDGSIWLWDAVTGAKQRIIRSHGKSIKSIDFSPKEKLIASGSIDGIIRLWNSTTGATRGILTVSETLDKVAFSPDGASLASLSSSVTDVGWYYTVCMWDIASHAKRWTFVYDIIKKKHERYRYMGESAHISFLSDGTHVAYGHRFVSGLLDSKTGKSVCIMAEYGGEICSSRRSSGRQMVVVNTSGRTELFDVQPRVRRRWYSETGPAIDITFSPDDRFLAACVRDYIELLETTSGHTTNIIPCNIHIEGIALSADGTFIASASGDNIIRFWNLSVNRQQSVSRQRQLSTNSRSSDLMRRSSYVTTTSNCARFVALVLQPSTNISGLFTPQLFIWDAHKMRMKKTIRITGKSGIRCMRFSPNLQLIAICWRDNVVDLFECDSGKKVPTILTSTGRTSYYYSRVDAYIDSALSPDGNLLVLYANSGHYKTTVGIHLHIWDIQRGAIAYKFQVEQRQVAFSQDSKRMAYQSRSGEISVFDFKTRSHSAQIEVDKNLKFWSFDSNDRLVLFHAAKPSGPIPMSARWSVHRWCLTALNGIRSAQLISHVIQLKHAPSQLLSFKPVPAANVVIVKLAGRCEIWDMTTGMVMGSFEKTGKLEYCQLLPCKAHLRIDEAIVPLRQPDSLGCCSHRLSLEGLWIKRGNEKLVCISPDYASTLIAVRCKGASFQSITESSRKTSLSILNKPIKTLEFDFSGIENYI